MDTYTYKCPGCGASLEFDPKAGLLVCNNCGQLYVPNDVSGPEQDIKSETSSNFSVEQPAYQESAYQQPAYQQPAYQQPAYQESAYQQPTFQQPAYQEPTYQQSIFGNDNNQTNSIFGDSALNNDTSEFMDINIYHCSSCGSEIMTNDVEVSKFCSYCGQSTIMFDRVSREKKPKKIIPFSITKEQALNKAKIKFSEGKFLKDGIGNLSVESVYGIYMPYYGYDVDMHISAKVHIYDKDRATNDYYPKAEMSHTVLLDASKRFNDYASKQLNPFPVDSAVDFNAAYLTGFYADRNDVRPDDRTEDAKEYLREIVLEKAIEQTPAPSREMRENYAAMYAKTGAFKVEIIDEQCKVKDKTYMFCPVYFITFNLGGDLVILLVNGSTGKIVGALPVDEKKVATAQKRDMLIFGGIFGVIGIFIFAFLPIWWSGMLYLILAGSLFMSGSTAKKKYDKLYTKTNSESMFDLSRNRE